MKRSQTDCNGSGPHSNTDEVRVLPTGGSSNAILCRTCFEREMHFRRVRNKELGNAFKFDLPEWTSLRVYEGAP